MLLSFLLFWLIDWDDVVRESDFDVASGHALHLIRRAATSAKGKSVRMMYIYVKSFMEKRWGGERGG